MQKHLENLESNELKEWEELLERAKSAREDFLYQADLMENALNDRAVEYHKKIGEILEHNRNQLEEMKTSNLVVLRRQEEAI